jgi:8-oxo-dGTP pyrophosphatase MutT (NUDIX family)
MKDEGQDAQHGEDGQVDDVDARDAVARDAIERGAAPGGRPDAPGSPWRTLAARQVYRNPWLTVTEHAVIRPDGQPGIYGVVDPGDNVTIVAIGDPGGQEERVWLVGEFLYALQAFEWFLPTGAIEPGEEPLGAARRELAEETGLRADEWTLLGAYPLSPGISRQVSYIYLARGLISGAPRPDGTERIATRTLPLRDVLHACVRGEIRAAVAVIGIWRAWAELHGMDRGGAGSAVEETGEHR